MTLSMGTLLDLDAPVGRYQVDKLVEHVPVPRSPHQRWSHRDLRQWVNGIAEVATEFADGVGEDKVQHENARAHLSDLLLLARRAGVIAARDTKSFAYAFMRDDDDDELAPALHALREVAERARALAVAIDDLAARRVVGKAINTHGSPPLLLQFVEFAASRWEGLSGRPAPRSKSGPMVRFMVAAWADLGFPDLGDCDAVLGRLAERRKPELP